MNMLVARLFGGDINNQVTSIGERSDIPNHRFLFLAVRLSKCHTIYTSLI